MEARIFDLTLRLFGAGAFPPADGRIDFPALNDKDWAAIGKLAHVQKFDGHVTDALALLDADKRPPQAVNQKLAMGVAYNITQHCKHNAVIADLFDNFSKAGLRPVLLKGMGLARLYSEPKYRIVGDIDICILPGEWKQAVQVVKGLEVSSLESHDTGMHFVFEYKHVVIELHRRPSEIFHSRRRDAEFQQWAETELGRTREGFWANRDGKMPQHSEGGSFNPTSDGAVWVPTPPPDFNILYVFLHLWSHIYYEHPMLRSIADWLMAIRCYRDAIDWQQLEERLRHYDLLYPWQLVGCFAVKCMGVKAEDIPCYDAKQMRKAEALRAYFIKEADGIANVATTGNAIARKAANLAYYFKMLRHKAPFLPPRMIANYIANIAHHAIHGLADEKESL